MYVRVYLFDIQTRRLQGLDEHVCVITISEQTCEEMRAKLSVCVVTITFKGLACCVRKTFHLLMTDTFNYQCESVI